MCIVKINKLRGSNMRWYDIEPDVCMAISMIECSGKNAQIKYANYIIEQIQAKDKEMQYIQNITKDNLAKKYLRWYDKNEIVSKAFAYLKATTQNIQKEVALSVLAYKNTQEAIA